MIVNNHRNNEIGKHDVWYWMINIPCVLYMVIFLIITNKGWLIRVALGFVLNENDQEEKDEYYHSDDDRTKHTIVGEKDKRNASLKCITGLVILGSPHMSPKHNCMDITRRVLR